MRKILLISFLIFSYCFAEAQFISGVVNRYYKVLKVDRDNGWVKLAVADGILPTYKKALLIQMKGADMDETNTAAFGNITDVNNAGNFELVNLCAFNSDTVIFENRLNNYFTDGEPIQLVAIPNYTNVTISDTLKGTPWDLTTGVGGVIAIDATDTVYLDKPIDASGIGFRGATLDTFVDCTFGGNVTNYYMPYNNMPFAAIQGAKKGEGITPIIANKEYGRGKQVNGGGGGNNHNAGGGGGSNYGNGGGGGNRTVGGCKSNSPGIGGLALQTVYDTCRTRLFLGGGGGSGHANKNSTFYNTGKPGGHGGGIIIITARVIKNNGSGALLADGLRPYDANTIPAYNNPHDADSDGGGGGGGGGVILLNCPGYVGNIAISVTGAKGSNVGLGMISTFCDAPGGGGGGGLILLTTAAVPGVVTTNVSGGASGLVLSPAPACTGTSNGAGNGANGNVFLNYIPPLPRDSTPICKQVVPVDLLLSFKGRLVEKNILLTATVSDIAGIMQLRLQRSFNGNDFEEIFKTGNNGRNEYTMQDVFQFRTVYYRVLALNRGGRTYCSPVLTFTGKPSGTQTFVNIYPNPVITSPMLFLNTAKAQKIMAILYDAAGKKIYQQYLQMIAGENRYRLPVANLSGGLYYVKCIGENFSSTTQFVKYR